MSSGSITFGAPTSVARTVTGWANKAWTLSAGNLPATASVTSVGNSTPYLKFQMTPSNPVGSIPTQLQLTITMGTSTGSEPQWSLDTIQVGDASGPLGPNAGNGNAIGGSGGVNFGVDTSGTGLSVAQFNAGDMYLWVAFKNIASRGSISTSSASGTDLSGPWTKTITPITGDCTHTQASTSHAKTDCTSMSLLVTSAGTGTYTYIYVTVNANAVALSGTGNGDYTGTNSAGGSASVSGAVPQTANANTVVGNILVSLSGGSGSAPGYTASAEGTATSGTPNIQATAGFTAFGGGVFTANLLTFSSMTALYTIPGGGGSGGAGGGGGAFGGVTLSSGAIGLPVGIDEMTTLYIDDVLTFYGQMTQYSTGAAFDATGSPAYRIYEGATDTPVLTGSMSTLDASNTDGFYSAQVTLSAANGFEVGECYCVRVSATVDSVDQAGIVERFIIRDPLATQSSVDDIQTTVNTIETDVTEITGDTWDTPLPDFIDTRAATQGDALAQIWRYLYNRNVVDKNAQTMTLSNDAGAASALTASVTNNSQVSDKGTIG